MSTLPPDFAAKIRSIGNRLHPDALAATQALVQPMHGDEPYSGVTITRDTAYGDHPRHRLDIFRPDRVTEPTAVLLFLPGGGFVAGDKKRPGTPFQDQIGVWAARAGLIGVTMNYRLAPDHSWPCGVEDIEAALAYVRTHIAPRVVLMGTSAGAIHVASYIAQRDGAGAAAAIMLSGLYDIPSLQDRSVVAPNYGNDTAQDAARSSLPALIETKLPWLAVFAEHDPPDFEHQALKLVNRYVERHGTWPNVIRLIGHNHYSAALHLNTADDWLGRQLLDFIARV